MGVERWYSKEHMWVVPEGDVARVGLSAYAVAQLQQIMFVNLPDVDERICRGERLGDVESIKTVSDLLSPIDGTVSAVNEAVVDEPELVEGDPLGSWLVELSFEGGATAVEELAGNGLLFSEADYLAQVAG